jgi:hypothetical protein
MHKRFVIGVDRAKMRLYDVEQGGQEGLADAGHAPPTPPKKNFDGFKI